MMENLTELPVLVEKEHTAQRFLVIRTRGNGMTTKPNEVSETPERMPQEGRLRC
jgi:hypothetical protein